VELLTDRARFLVECLDLPTAAQVEGAKWERFQIDHLNDDSIFRIEDKSRQIAWSFTVAAEAVANAILDGESTIFVSINQEEAKEKTLYAQRVLGSLQISGLPKVVSDTVLGLKFSNGARILSLPSTPPRGKAQMNVVLDEFAHVQHDREIYTASLPIISKGGRLRIGSSPMGAAGTFWEISQQEIKAYPGFKRIFTPWYKIKSFRSEDAIGADEMDTETRVERFGNDRIKMIYSNMLLDDFQQEYECMYVDEAVSFFPWSLIRKNQDENLLCYKISSPHDLPLREIKADIAAGRIESVLVGGVDVGRKRDLTEIFFLGFGDKTPLRIMISLDKAPFDVQEGVIRQVLEVLPVGYLLIDQNGIGMHLAERLASDTVAEGVTFTNASKHLWATEVKIQLEKENVPIPADRDLAYQIHSVKRMVTAAKNTVFDTDRNEKHHADKFWALALAVWAAREEKSVPVWAPSLGRIR
jgi:phage FluMu gp28-like protein